MTDHREATVISRPGKDLSAQDGLTELLAAYHLRTQAEKGEAVADVDELPDRYRTEITHPQTVIAVRAAEIHRRRIVGRAGRVGLRDSSTL